MCGGGVKALSITLVCGIDTAFAAGSPATAGATQQIKSTVKISQSLCESGRKMVDGLVVSLRTVFVLCGVRIVEENKQQMIEDSFC